VKPAAAIFDDDLEDAFAPFFKRLYAERNDFTADGRWLAELQIPYLLEMPSILMTPRPVEQKVFQSAQAESFKLPFAVASNPQHIVETQAQTGRRNGHGAFIKEGAATAKNVVLQ
jgi:hypothetical protein